MPKAKNMMPIKPRRQIGLRTGRIAPHGNAVAVAELLEGAGAERVTITGQVVTARAKGRVLRMLVMSSTT